MNEKNWQNKNTWFDEVFTEPIKHLILTEADERSEPMAFELDGFLSIQAETLNRNRSYFFNFLQRVDTYSDPHADSIRKMVREIFQAMIKVRTIKGSNAQQALLNAVGGVNIRESYQNLLENVPFVEGIGDDLAVLEARAKSRIEGVLGDVKKEQQVQENKRVGGETSFKTSLMKILRKDKKDKDDVGSKSNQERPRFVPASDVYADQHAVKPAKKVNKKPKRDASRRGNGVVA